MNPPQIPAEAGAQVIPVTTFWRESKFSDSKVFELIFFLISAIQNIFKYIF